MRSDNNLLNIRIELILKLIPKISDLILSYSNFQYYTKNDGSILTNTDIEVENLIKSHIIKNFSNDSIISEESDNIIGYSSFVWTIDPIDGTLPFVCSIPSYSCLIGIIFEQQPIFGLAIFLGLNISIYAIKGFGAFQRKDKIYSKITSSKKAEDKSVWSCTDIKFFNSDKWKNVFNYLQNGYKYNKTWGDAFGHILVATEKIDLMIDPDPILNLWDVAPLIPILAETNKYYITLPIGKSLFDASGLISSDSLSEIDEIKSLLI